MVAKSTAGAVEPWWIIGSAAVALTGAHGVEARDVDLLMSVGDAQQLLRRVDSGSLRAEPDPLFRSDIFGTWMGPPLPVEVMGGFSYLLSGSWRPVWPTTRLAVMIDGHMLFVPAPAELRALLLAFGRDKDVERAALIPS